MFGQGDDWLTSRVIFIIPLMLSLGVHEFAHAWAAFKLGDDTAARQGRLTLNPLAHIDPVGLLLPLMGVPFGWAKPVPINPARFSRSVSMETGLVLTASAGPLSNVAIAVAATLALALTARFSPGVMGGAVWSVGETLVTLNLILAIFNLLPIVPLDGSRIADGLMPAQLRPAWEAFARIGPMLLIAVLVLPSFLGFSVISWPLRISHELLVEIFRLVAG